MSVRLGARLTTRAGGSARTATAVASKTGQIRNAQIMAQSRIPARARASAMTA